MRGDTGVTRGSPHHSCAWQGAGGGVGLVWGGGRGVIARTHSSATSCHRMDAGAGAWVCWRGGLWLSLPAPGIRGGKLNEHPGLCRGGQRCWGSPPWHSIPGGWQGAGGHCPRARQAGGRRRRGRWGQRGQARGGDGWGSAGGVSVGLLRPEADLWLTATGLQDRSLGESQGESFPGGRCSGTGAQISHGSQGAQHAPCQSPRNIGVCLGKGFLASRSIGAENSLRPRGLHPVRCARPSPALRGLRIMSLISLSPGKLQAR